MAAGKPHRLSDFDRMQQRMEGLLRHLLREARLPAALGIGPHWSPAVDVYETARHYVILVELPGVERERIEVTVQENRLVLSGERCEPLCPDAKVHLHQMEIDYGRFLRGIELPEAPDPDSVEASYEHGFLRIRVSKPAHRRSVTVKAEREGD
jgi:HSP20 family protein